MATLSCSRGSMRAIQHIAAQSGPAMIARGVSGRCLHTAVSQTNTGGDVHPLAFTGQRQTVSSATQQMPNSARLSLQTLVADLTRILGQHSGILNGSASPDTNVRALQRALTSYTSHDADWRRYAIADPSVPYTRNLVSTINQHANLLVLVWNPGCASPIHDHSGAHCLMKILKGSLRETLYAWPCENEPAQRCSGPAARTPTHKCTLASRPSQPLQVRRERTYGRDQVTYMSDRLGLHRITNPSAAEVAVSLHLYTPPNAAKHGSHVFDAETGASKHVAKCGFHSVYGLKGGQAA
ncbi:hypothetical protein B0A48_11601 [Cryoendolithus antarcticus]|uniref:Cysteine dioxygenase n=1 Tax=Cryoendolithus antarcticus TaxID=1507870 RepID=A0A1V8SVY8_9PEZI|nr:hypothetical protein B0A48_11601 [Cryoendolithus antarcticus]